MIDRFEPPAAGADVDLFDEIEEQLAGPSLSAEERDEILDTELPRDVENRQEVYRPAFKDSGQRWATCLLIYSGLVKNLELIPDELKRQHLSRVLRGWAYLTARSEEHTSELQSLMRISYAVFCLKKKKYSYNTL